ncbi:hypothetical protein HPB49_024577 [Dermacentor silvarum]|uniref:Uncharacterized protein n=1 Tax=Dermacentor silvarum TaxID=543639 RepID=A0ACB8D0M3_DERSI|nr:hypothetical protein HPB49_024577 [Dermacentor silvarum]
MFRRKPPLPTRPTPPTFEAIQEDLNNASEDIVFTLLPDGSNLDAATDGAVASTDESDGPMTADAAFLKVKHFMEMSDKIAGLAEVLQKKTEHLKSVRDDLHNEIERLALSSLESSAVFAVVEQDAPSTAEAVLEVLGDGPSSSIASVTHFGLQSSLQ